MKFFNKFFLFFFLFITLISQSVANEKSAFIDIDYIIQNSIIGKKTLDNIKDLNQKNIDQLEKKNKSLRDLESQIKNKKNIISEDDFNKEVEIFKSKIQDFNREKDKTVKKFNNFRKEELEKILKLFNPIISEYMKKNSINLLIDSKNVFMANKDSNITQNIMTLINEKLK